MFHSPGPQSQPFVHLVLRRRDSPHLLAQGGCLAQERRQRREIRGSRVQAEEVEPDLLERCHRFSKRFPSDSAVVGGIATRAKATGGVQRIEFVDSGARGSGSRLELFNDRGKARQLISIRFGQRGKQLTRRNPKGEFGGTIDAVIARLRHPWRREPASKPVAIA